MATQLEPRTKPSNLSLLSTRLSSLAARLIRANRSASYWLVKKFPRFFYPDNIYPVLDERIDATLRNGVSHVLEVGGIDRPMLGRGRGYQYHGMDLEHRPGCDTLYDTFLLQSIEERIKGEMRFDMIVSTTLLEHVPDNTESCRTLFEALSPSGATHHYVPARWHPYSVILRMVGPNLQKVIIRYLRPDSIDVTGYPAFFNHCTPGAMARDFRAAGFSRVETTAFYRANDYFACLVPAFVLVTLFENLCSGMRWSFFASGFVISGWRQDAKAD